MLAIGRILRTGARLLLLDEPTEGLAPVIIQQIGKTIRTLKEQGFTILLVEQNFRFASTVADRYYVMETWPGRRKLRQCRTGRQSRKAARLSRGLNDQNRVANKEEWYEDVFLSLAALAVVLAASIGAGAADHRQDRRAERHVEPLRRHRRTGLGRRRQAGDRRLHAKDNPNVKVELVSADHQNKPDVGSERRQQVVRHREGRHDHRRAELRRRARGQPDRAPARTRCSSSPARRPPT